MQAPAGVVWVLGAGFSRFLGAPLLDELLTTQSAQTVNAAYADGPPFVTQDFELVAAVFETGKKLKFWTDAEGFLEKFDRARKSETVKKVLAREVNLAQMEWVRLHKRREVPSFMELRPFALQLMAAEVSLFTRDADIKQERWAPYAAWVKSLAATDTVLTFNYDNAPELLRNVGTNLIQVPLPERQIKYDTTLGAPVLKMHGSTTWIRKDDGPITYQEDAYLYPRDGSTVMATPGPTKHELITSGDFAPMWNYAAQAVENAQVLVLVGYRMPPTDAGTKQWFVDRLRGWLARHSSDTQMLRIHVVLGPDPNHEHAQRLKGLIKSISSTQFEPMIWPMFAEDFLGLFKREELYKSRPLNGWPA